MLPNTYKVLFKQDQKVDTSEEYQAQMEGNHKRNAELAEVGVYHYSSKRDYREFTNDARPVEVRLYTSENFVSERRYSARYTWSWALKKIVRNFEWVATTFKLDKNGRVVVYRVRPQGVYNMTYQLHDILMDCYPETQEALEQTFGNLVERIIRERRPQLAGFGAGWVHECKDPASKDLPKYLRKEMGVNYNRAVLKTFGSIMPITSFTNWKKDVAWASAMAKHFPIEWILEHIKHTASVKPTHYRQWFMDSSMDTAFALLSKKAVWKTLTDSTGAAVDMQDCLRMIDRLQEMGVEYPLRRNTRPEEWGRIHRELVMTINRVQDQNLPINQNAKALAMDNMEVPGTNLTIVTAKETHDLLEWGNDLRNCIAGYKSQALKGTTTLFGLFDEEQELVACGEIGMDNWGNPDVLVQLLGMHNAPLEADIFNAVEQYLMYLNVIAGSSDTTWGRPRQ